MLLSFDSRVARSFLWNCRASLLLVRARRPLWHLSDGETTAAPVPTRGTARIRKEARIYFARTCGRILLCGGAARCCDAKKPLDDSPDINPRVKRDQAT